MPYEPPMDDLISITGGPLRPHEYVLVVPELTAADEAWIQNHMARVRGGPSGKGGGRDGEDMEITFALGDVQLATLKRVIRGWSLTRSVVRADGTSEEAPIPFSPQAIERLPSRIYKYLLKKYNEMQEAAEGATGTDGEGGGPESDDAFLPVVVDSSEDNFHAERVVRLRP